MSPRGNFQPNYRLMAEFRYQIRRFLRFSEDTARAGGLEPQQYQLMLALKGMPAECARVSVRWPSGCRSSITARWNWWTGWPGAG